MYLRGIHRIIDYLSTHASRYISLTPQPSPPHTALDVRHTGRCQATRHTAMHCNTLQHNATHCNTLQHNATHGNTRRHSAPHYNALQWTSRHKPSSDHSATAIRPHCNSHQSTLKHHASHSNILHYRMDHKEPESNRCKASSGIADASHHPP